MAEARAAGVTGRTRLIGIIADPIARVQAPTLINPLLASRGADAVLVPFHVASDRFDSALQGLRAVRNLAGLIVTMPHKEAAAAAATELTPAARLASAVNVLRFESEAALVGALFDGEGFLAALRADGHSVEGRRVLVLGAGGAAAAIAFALAGAGVAGLTLHNRTAPRAQALAARLEAAFPPLSVRVGGPDPRGHDLVVNAAAVGFRPDEPLLLDAARLEPTMVCCEIVMQPEVTPFVACAREAGCAVMLGRAMLEHQLELMLQFLGFPREG